MINTTKDLPLWYARKNYQKFDNFDTNKLKEQFAIRVEIFNWMKLSKELDDFNPEYPFGEYQYVWESIMKDTIAIKNPYLPDEIDNPQPLRRLNTSNSVKGVKAWTAYHFIQETSQKGLILEVDDHGPTFIPDFCTGDISMLSKYFSYSSDIQGLYINPDIENYSDAEILESIKELLPQWRDQLGLPEPEIKFAKTSDFKKIKTYSLLPLFDLIMWAESVGQKIPPRIMTIALFPHGEKGETELSVTIYPFINKMMDDSYRELKNK